MIFILGEAYGREEEIARAPFVGASGRFLRQQLSSVGIRFEDCYATNVFNLRPQPTNDVKNLCGPKSTGLPGMPALVTGKYVRSEYGTEITRLYQELSVSKPSLILALGGTACWSLGLSNSIKKIRGAPVMTKWGKVFPTVHPAAIFRDFSLRPVFYADLQKVVHEASFPEVRRPARTLWVEPSFEDLLSFERDYIRPSKRLSVDIETSDKYITCIGFAPSKEIALVLPFIRSNGTPYWKTEEEELQAWTWCKQVCQSHPHIIGQNFLYDAHRLWRTYGITTPGLQDDTMLLHHALYPELDKGLGFLGSVYTGEARWKSMRSFKENFKKEDK